MKKLHLLLSSTVIAAVNLASIVVGFLVYSLIGDVPQLAVQLPVALAVGILGVAAWLLLFRRFHQLVPDEDYIIVFLAAFPMGTVLFALVHYAVTGYLTSFGNIGGVWGLQFAENMIALPVVASILRDSPGTRCKRNRSVVETI